MGYTNSPLVVYTKLSPNHSGQRTHSIDRITPHCVVGQLSAESICGCFTSTSRQASCNYGIGTDGRVSLCVKEKNRSWCSSSNANDQRAVTIECASDMNEPYAMNSAVYDSLVKLCIDICKRNGKKKLLWLGDKNKTLNYAPAADEMVLTVHRWFANKSCPGNWLYARLGDLAARVTAALGGSSSSGMQASSLKNLSEAEAVAKIGPLFTANQKTTGILACVSMAQFILESGYGKSELAQNANNCFGMKTSLSGNSWSGSSWDGKSVYPKKTQEQNTDGSYVTITADFRKYRSSINKGEAPRYYVKNHHVGIIDRVTWDKVQTMLFEKPRADMTKGPGKKKVKSIKGSPFGNLRCGAILENGPDAGKPCGEGFFRTTYTGVANGYSDERSLKATGEDTGEYLEKYTYSYPVWRCKRKVGERDGEPPKNGSPDQKAYCRSKKGCMSDEEKEAANKRCPSERYHECALEQSFMELLYSMKRDFEQHGDASMIVAMFDNAYEQAVRLANNNSISVQRMATVENQIKEMEERLQDAISHQVAALREAALEQNVELNEALSNGEVTIDDIDLDIRSGLTPGSIGVSFYGTETEEGSEAQIYTELVNDLQERLKTLQQERQTIEEEQGVLAIMKKNFEYFLACLKELPDTNAGGMPLRVNGLDVQGTLLRDVDGNAIEGRKRAITSGKLKLTPERIAEAPDMLHFEKGIYCAFVESGVLQGDVATYKTNFGVTLTSKGNRRTLDSFMGYKRSDMDGNVVYVDAPYKVYGFSIQYRRYLTTAAKREREEAV